MKRLEYLDSMRGFAVVYMLFFQIANMFTSKVDIYGYGWHRFIIQWVSLFMIVAGFSMSLMYEKYNRKQFYLEVGKRFLLFTSIAWFLTFWCGFGRRSFLWFDGEAVGAIGLALTFLSFWFLPIKKREGNNSYYLIWFMVWCSIFSVLNHFLDLYQSFPTLGLISFMMFGIVLSYLREHKRSWLLLGILMTIIGIYNNEHITWSRNIQYFILNCGMYSIGFYVSALLQRTKIIQFLSYFGKHALFFYFMHYFLIFKLLLLTNLGQTFILIEGIGLTILSVGILVLLEKNQKRIKGLYLPR